MCQCDSRTVKAEEFNSLTSSAMHSTGHSAPLQWICFSMCVCVFVIWVQVTVPAPAELFQSGATDRVRRSARQPRHGHWEQHQVPGGLSHHPCPSSRLGHRCTVTHANPYCRELHLYSWRDPDVSGICNLCLQVSCVRTWSSLKPVFDVSELFSSVQSPLCSCSIL